METAETIRPDLIKEEVYGERLHFDLSQKIVCLHQQGYVLDFYAAGRDHIICLQDNHLFSINEVVVKKNYHTYDTLRRLYKLIYTVETCCGYNGILMKDLIYRKELIL